LQIVTAKKKRVILYGDWNINFMEDSAKIQGSHDVKITDP
jgi:hypothetical protein